MIVQVAPRTIGLNRLAEHPAIMREWQEFASCSSVEDNLSDEEFCSTMLAGCIDQYLDNAPRVHGASSAVLRQCRSLLACLASEDPSRNAMHEIEYVRQAHFGALLNRRLFLTQHGRLGVGSKSLKQGDYIWLVGGSTAPLILRHASGDAEPTGQPQFNLVGHAYVHGIMQGEATCPSPTLETFVLV